MTASTFKPFNPAGRVPSAAWCILEWITRPHTQYEVWFTAALSNSWSLTETIPTSTEPTLMREYLPDPESPASLIVVFDNTIAPVND